MVKCNHTYHWIVQVWSDTPGPALPVGVTGPRPGSRAELKPATGVGHEPANPSAGKGLSRILAVHSGDEAILRNLETSLLAIHRCMDVLFISKKQKGNRPYTMEIDDSTGGSVWQTQVRGIDNFKEEWDRLRGWIVYEPVYHDFTATFYEYWNDYDIISEVNNNHPFILGLENGGSATDGTGPYGNHAVTGVGYIAACSEYLVLL